MKTYPRDVTVLFLRQSDKLLIAMKKRGFGKGKWNGVGGKVEPGETIEDAVVRETQEEIGVTPLKYEKVAVLNFKFDNHKQAGDLQMRAHVYICTKWSGKPVETDEMRPKWVNLAGIPFNEMWSDDIYWLPVVLHGDKINADIFFDGNDQVTTFSAKPL